MQDPPLMQRERWQKKTQPEVRTTEKEVLMGKKQMKKGRRRMIYHFNEIVVVGDLC